MNRIKSPTIPITRQPNESDAVWSRRLVRHIKRNAPDEYRPYVANGKPGLKSARWALPGVFFVLGLFFIIAGYFNSSHIRELNGSNSAEGTFIVDRLERQQRYGVLKENSPVVPVVTVRNEAVVPLYSHSHSFAAGEPVTLKYTQQGDVVASFMDADGNIPNTSFRMMLLTASLFIGLGVIVALYYRGVVDEEYIDREFARLIKRQ